MAKTLAERIVERAGCGKVIDSCTVSFKVGTAYVELTAWADKCIGIEIKDRSGFTHSMPISMLPVLYKLLTAAADVLGENREVGDVS